MSAQLTSVPDDGEFRQTAFDEEAGFPKVGLRFTLKSVANLWTDEDKALKGDQQVHGRFRGIVDNVHTTRDKDGSWLWVYDIRVDDADLEA